jgi:polyisoprenyl-phosphate glycosyltransferase
MKSNIHLSVVVPVYGCKTVLIELYLRLKQTLTTIAEDFEIIMINDASPDGPWETIVELANKDKRVKGINFSRNFGQHYAITAGLDKCIGRWIVIMDCDLQDIPEEIPTLYKKALEGYDIVFGQRLIRFDNFFKKIFSKFFYKALEYFTETKQDYSIGNFGIYGKKAVESVLSMGDKIRFFPPMIKWVGFKSISVPVKHAERSYGKTSYSFRKLFHLALNTILTFSDKPLRLTVKLGSFIVFSSIIFSIYNLILFFNGKILAPGWTSIIISIWFLSGIIIFTLGLVGLYIGKIFENIKNRPIYIINEKVNL